MAAENKNRSLAFIVALFVGNFSCFGAERQFLNPHLIGGLLASIWNDHPGLVITHFAVLTVLTLLVSVLAIRTARLRTTQAALKSSEAMFRTLFEHAAIGALQADARTGKFMKVNNRICQMLGWSCEELLKMDYREITHPEDLMHDQVQVKRLLSGEIREYTHNNRYIRKDGSVFWATLSAAAYGNGRAPDWLIVTVQDITALKQAEEQLIQAERLAAVGQLSSGIAHEFNNMLMIILGYNDLLKTQSERLPEIAEVCQVIGTQVLRGRDIVAQLLALADPSPLRMEVFKLNDLAEEVLRAQAEQLESEKIEVVREYSAEPFIRGDHRQLHQAVASLVVNARHAIRVKGKGKITLRIIASPDGAELSIIDDGVGMSNDVKHKIFTPFFTTKGGFSNNALGIKGSGLGLCVCLRTVKMHSGKITFHSVEKEGTRFTILLPVETASASDKTVPLPLPKMTPGPRDPKLLVVDDETAICDVLQQMLRKRGFSNVDTASSGESGLEKIARGAYDIAFVDLKMSGMGGLELLKAACSRGIKTRFVFISGQLEVTEAELLNQGASGFLYKPFSVVQLDETVQRVLKESSSTTPAGCKS